MCDFIWNCNLPPLPDVSGSRRFPCRSLALSIDTARLFVADTVLGKSILLALLPCGTFLDASFSATFSSNNKRLLLFL